MKGNGRGPVGAGSNKSTLVRQLMLTLDPFASAASSCGPADHAISITGSCASWGGPSPGRQQADLT